MRGLSLLLFLRAMASWLFLKIVEARPIQGFPEEHHERKSAWVLSIVAVLLIASGSSHFYSKQLPSKQQEPNLASLIESGFRDIKAGISNKKLPAEIPKPDVTKRSDPPKIRSRDSSIDTLLKRAESAIDACKAFTKECNNRGDVVRSRVITKNAEPDVTDSSKGQFARWAWHNKAEQDNTRYVQIYRDEFQGVMRSMLLSGATEAYPGTDFSRWSGTVTCLDIGLTTASYADYLRNKKMKGVIK